PSRRMSAGTRSRALTATAPASSAILACSAVTTSMMTPPLSISAKPALTFQVPFRSFILPEPSATGSFYCWLRAIQAQLVDATSRTGRGDPAATLESSRSAGALQDATAAGGCRDRRPGPGVAGAVWDRHLRRAPGHPLG